MQRPPRTASCPCYLHGDTHSTLLSSARCHSVSSALREAVLAALPAGLPLLVKDLTAVAGVRFTEARLCTRTMQARPGSKCLAQRARNTRSGPLFAQLCLPVTPKKKSLHAATNRSCPGSPYALRKAASVWHPPRQGSLLHKDRVAAHSDQLVEVLEANGAIVLGKTNTPEFGAGGNTFNECALLA